MVMEKLTPPQLVEVLFESLRAGVIVAIRRNQLFFAKSMGLEPEQTHEGN